ncbi:hypothetical protein, partial [Streptomyces sp. P17]|uniref:hypothetical protein n=1 Tax=Streptomyces sp. P17 TaxID=3074716 RepID=UPI0028F42BB9
MANTVFNNAGDTPKGVGGTPKGGGSLFSEIGKSFKTGKADGGFKSGIKSAFNTSKEVGSLGLNSVKDAYN